MQSIVAEKRDILGKKVKNLRTQGVLPAVVYGKGKDAEPISVKEGDFLKLWRSAGESTIVTLTMGNEKKNVLIQDVMFDPVKNIPIHADFFMVDMEKPIRISVPFEFIGESDAIKNGGILVKVMHSLNIEALPKNLPHNIPVDITALKNMGDAISVKDITIPAGVAVIDGLEEVVVMAEAPRVEEEVKEERTLDSIEVVGKKEKEAEAAAEAAAETK